MCCRNLPPSTFNLLGELNSRSLFFHGLPYRKQLFTAGTCFVILLTSQKQNDNPLIRNNLDYLNQIMRFFSLWYSVGTGIPYNHWEIKRAFRNCKTLMTQRSWAMKCKKLWKPWHRKYNSNMHLSATYKCLFIGWGDFHRCINARKSFYDNYNFQVHLT